MIEDDNYKLYLDEKFKNLTTLMNARFESQETLVNTRFENQDDKLDAIHDEQKRTNGRVTKLEDHREYVNKVIDTRVTSCPNVERNDERFEKIEKSIIDMDVKLDKELQDISFFNRHPKLVVAGLVFVVILTLATFIENNPLKVFDSTQPAQTEQTK